MATPIPPFSALPLDKSGPYLNAWGLYGGSDQLGTLNRLSAPIVLSAASEIRTGIRVSLNWALDAQNTMPFFGRQKFEQDMYEKRPRFVNDDVWRFNTQSSSQWDGLRHFGYQEERRFYNGVTMEEVHREGSTVNGVGVMAERGIVGRGVLLDFETWRVREGLEWEPMESGSITLEQLLEVARTQGTEIRFGDVLIVRSGYMAAYRKLSVEQLTEKAKTMPPSFGGVEQSPEMLEWIWQHFAAVAGDHPSFECWPAKVPGKIEKALHEVLLAGWGCPIGELFDLEKLAEECKRQNRWSFFVASEPCNVPGGVASPPNILAIF